MFRPFIFTGCPQTRHCIVYWLYYISESSSWYELIVGQFQPGDCDKSHMHICVYLYLLPLSYLWGRRAILLGAVPEGPLFDIQLVEDGKTSVLVIDGSGGCRPLGVSWWSFSNACSFSVRSVPRNGSYSSHQHDDCPSVQHLPESAGMILICPHSITKSLFFFFT